MSKTFFQKNRQNIADKITQENSVIIVASHSQQQAKGDVGQAFRQEPNFYYLTGLEEPDAVLVILPVTKKAPKVFLIVDDRSDQARLWTGQKTIPELKAICGIDSIYQQEKGHQLLDRIISSSDNLYLLGTSAEHGLEPNGFPNSVLSDLQKKFPLKEYHELIPLISELRVIKDDYEVQQLQSAIDITAQAFASLSEQLSSINNEAQAHAIILSEFIKNMSREAYPSIVASARNACQIHYEDNNKKIENGSLLLVDAGCEVNGYAADISRTLPIGKISARQTEVFEAVKQVQKECLKEYIPGASMHKIEQKAEKSIARQLKKLGIIRDIDDLNEVRKYYPHAIGHHVGLEVHDVHTRSDILEPGMVLTCEPGIYIPEEEIGVRIEDMVLITTDSNQLISSNIASDIE